MGVDYVVSGQIGAAFGRNVTLKTDSSLEGRIIKSITTEGPDGPTNANQQRAYAVLRALQGGELLQNPFLRYIFQPSAELEWPETFPTVDTLPNIVTTRPLNDSQRRAVEHMLLQTDETRMTMIQGPPGTGMVSHPVSAGTLTDRCCGATGKTTVIAAFVCSAVAAGANGIWLVAQSNIAVKNIAEKLADVGFLNWKLLVSTDFHVGWFVVLVSACWALSLIICVGMSTSMATS